MSSILIAQLQKCSNYAIDLFYLFHPFIGAYNYYDQKFVKKHANELSADGVERPAARLFSNPPGDYGSMVNEVVGSGDWANEDSLGETWKGRNVFAYGRNEGSGSGGQTGTARPEVLDKLLSTTERVVQEIDSVEYGLTDIQEVSGVIMVATSIYYPSVGSHILVPPLPPRARAF